MHKLIILRGNSGSGKTTVARALQTRFGQNTMRISQDSIRREMLRVDDGKDTKALPLMKKLLEYGSTHSEIVILEGIMRAEWYGPLFELATELYYKEEIYAYYFDLSFDETLRRHQTRISCREFGESEMRQWWREKDFSDVLCEKSITGDKSLEVIVSEIYRAIVNN